MGSADKVHHLFLLEGDPAGMVEHMRNDKQTGPQRDPQ